MVYWPGREYKFGMEDRKGRSGPRRNPQMDDPREYRDHEYPASHSLADFFLGRAKKSGREGFIVYMGNDVFGVKWRNWKLHFKEQSGWNGVLREYTMPRAYNLLSDPQERDNVLFPHTWVPKAALPQLEEHVASLKEHPPVPTGAPDPYQPPK